MSVYNVTTLPDYRHDTDYLVKQHLKFDGYIIADTSGVAVDHKESSLSFGVLDSVLTSVTIDTLLGRPIKVKARKFIGVLILSDQPTINWRFEVNSEEYVSQAQYIAEQLTHAFRVNIDIKLVYSTQLYELHN